MSAGECRKKLTIFSKNAEGQTGTGQTGQMICQDQVSDTFCCLTLDMGISPGPCEDPSSAITRQLNGTLHAIVEVIRDQKNRRGCFSGNWQLSGRSGVVAAGELSGTVGAGTHRSPAVPQVCAVSRRTGAGPGPEPVVLVPVLSGAAGWFRMQ
jgi:hypothetical protein